MAPLSKYVQAEIEVLEHYGVEYLDLSDKFYVPETSGYGELFGDGLHPNPKGLKLLADCLIAYLEKKGVAC